MPKYTYIAKKSPTEVIKGDFMADSRNAAIQRISQMGYFLVSINEESEEVPVAGAAAGYNFFKRITLKDINRTSRWPPHRSGVSRRACRAS